MMSDNLLGAIFAEMGSDTQAEFFNGIGRRARLTWKSELGLPDISGQCFHILKDLDQDGKKFIRELAAMVGSEEEEARQNADRRQTENTRIVSEAENRLRAISSIVDTWKYDGGEKEACAAMILQVLDTLETKP